MRLEGRRGVVGREMGERERVREGARGWGCGCDCWEREGCRWCDIVVMTCSEAEWVCEEERAGLA